MKLSFGIIVLNGEPFIKYNLKALYPHAHEILIVEGAVNKFAHAATPDGHSLDNTVDIIKSFPDPENKIKLIQRDGFWSEKDDMCNAYMGACTGDYIWQVDVDEFYKPEDIEQVRTILVSDPEISQVNFRSVCFWRSFKARIMGASFIFGADEFIRIFRYRPGYSYITHRPPTLANEIHRPFIHKRIVTAQEMEQQGIVQYHYSYIFPDGVKSKTQYYLKMGWGEGHKDGLKWFKKSWSKLSDPLRIHLNDSPPSWIEPFNQEHPDSVKKMINDIGFQEDPEVREYLIAEWEKFAIAGERIGVLCKRYKSGGISRRYAFVNMLMNIFFPKNIRLLNADKAIIKCAMIVAAGKRFEMKKPLDSLKKYPHFYLIRMVESKMLSDFLQNASPPFLDLGCGDGQFGRSLGLHQVYGIDKDTAALDKIHKDGYYSEIQTAKASAIPFHDGSFGTVYSNCAMEHMDELPDVLFEIRRVLRKDGVLVFTVPTPEFFKIIRKDQVLIRSGLAGDEVISEYNHFHHHVNILNLEQWSDMLNKCGFELDCHAAYLPGEFGIFVARMDMLYTIKTTVTRQLIKKHEYYYNSISGIGFRQRVKQYIDNSSKTEIGTHIIIKAIKRN